jgi:YVTN family beta-propeller protein
MMQAIRLCSLVAAVLAAAAILAPSPGADTPAGIARLRRPVALVPAADGKRLFVANRAGSVSVLDTAKRQVIAEIDAGRRLADLAAAPDGRLLAVDEAAGELLVLESKGESLTVAHRLRVGESPVSVRAAGDGSRALVACLWPRMAVVVDIPQGKAPRLGKTIALPFAPRLQLPLPGGDAVVVADAFGGRLAVVDARRGAVESVRALPGHNLRGLALSGDGKELLIAQQVLFEQIPTKPDEIRWGNVITNGLRSIPLADVRRPDADLVRGSRLQHLGDFIRGAADPASVVVAGERVLVALAGTGEVALGPGGFREDWPRLRVGRRPTALALGPDGRRAFVANTFGDSVSIIDLSDRKSVSEVVLGPQPTLGPAERGEMLFFDARLGKEGWMSCHSCHGDGHTNGLRSDTLGDGSYGAPKRVPSLLGAADTGPWAWDGSAATLKEQLRMSVRTTMNGPAPTEAQLADLEAYLRTLAPPPPMPGTEEEAVSRGRQVFEAQKCARCHAPPTYTTPKTYDVGLADEVGKTRFNPPSLRGAGHGTAFFHDGRAATLEEVFTRHGHQVPRDLPRKDLDDLLAFLRSL